MTPLEKFKRLEGEISPAPWKPIKGSHQSSGVCYSYGSGPKYLSGIAGDRLLKDEIKRLEYVPYDAQFIAEMRNLAPKLIKLWEAVIDGFASGELIEFDSCRVSKSLKELEQTDV